MKYQIVGGAGLHRSETKMFDMMVKQLPDSWFGYGGLVVTDRQGSMEIDALIITADRLLLVELKEWNGCITYEGGKWLQNGKGRGKSPYQIKRDHAQRLKTLLQEELSRKLGYFLHVEAHVVLCGTARPDNLPSNERRYVHTSDEFLTIGNPKCYEKLVQQTNFAHIFDNGKERPNSSQILPIIQAFFDGKTNPKIKALPLEVNGYKANDNPLFTHPHNVYNDFRATHKDNSQHQGLLRKWDFDALGVTNAIQSLWAEVALRETRVGRQVRNGSATIQDYMLRAVSELSEDDITDDARELFELRRSFSRLDEVIDTESDNWNKVERIDRVRALLAPFSELHALGVGHCDIDLHNLWYAGDQRSIVVTGFGAASIGGRDSLEVLRPILQSAPYILPEDAFEEAVEPFRLDVFMLAVVAYRICFPDDSLLVIGQVPEWKIPKEDPFDGALNNWFEQALNLEPSKRFPRADIMLNEFNSATKEQMHGHDEANQIYQELQQSEFFYKDMNSVGVIMKFQPLPEFIPDVYSALANIAITGSISYRCSQDNKLLSVKLWDGVHLNPQQPGVTRCIHAFKCRIDKLQKMTLPTPVVYASGLLGQGGLYVVSEYVEGQQWEEYIAELEQLQRIEIAKLLINTIHSFHEKQLPHGDLCPNNILVQSGDEPVLTLLGLLEYRDGLVADKRYQPEFIESTDVFGRDCFAVYRMVEELFSDNIPKSVLAELDRAKQSIDGIPIALDPLLQALIEPLQTELCIVDESNQEIVQAIPVQWHYDSWPLEMKQLEQNDDGYFFNCNWSNNPRFAHELRCYVTGLGEQLLIDLDPENRKIVRINYHNDLSIEETIRAGKYTQVKITTPLSIQRGILNDRNELIELLMNLEPVIDAIIERNNSNQEMDENDFDSGESSPIELWKALSDTEEELRDIVNIDSNNYQESLSGCLLYPYSTESGADLNFEFDDKIIVYIKDKRETVQLGELRLSETTPNLLAIRFDFDSARKRIGNDCQLQLESIRDKSSRELRQRALQRVIGNKAEIPLLPQYFDYNQKPEMEKMQPKPSSEVLRELYDSSDHCFNEQQLMAFQQLIELGPVGVLQGPPGTGKTTFISKFIHYLYSHCGVSNVLLVGQSHTAVDNVAIKARELCHNKGMELDTVRIGHEQMIDEGMLCVESKALQRQIQHKFHREYDLRVSALGKRLGMPLSLVAQLCQLHRTLNPLVVSFAQCHRELIKVNKVKSGNYQKRLTDLTEQHGLLIQRTQAVIHSMFASHLLEPLVYDDTLIRQLATLIAIQCNYNNPENLDRFLQLLEVSQEWMDVLRGGEAGFDRFMLKSKQLVCGTLVGVGRRRLELAESSFDWVIVDEAGRAQAAELMVALQSGKRVLLVGDHKQLSPFYHSRHLKLAAKKLELGHGIFYESDFERAFKASCGVTLDTQYRMVEPIGDLVSECFYAKDIGKLHSARVNSPDWYTQLPSPWNKAVSWIDSSSPNPSGGEEQKGNGRYYNQREIRLLMEVLQVLASEDSVAQLEKTITVEQPYPIGIITMYRQQKEDIDNAISCAEWAGALRGLIKIDTVDSYQGQENKIIILSLVRDNPCRLQGFLRDAPRINVAISRAQERLLILGACRMWSKDNNDSALGSVHEFISKQVAVGEPNYQMLCGQSLLGDNN